MAATVIRFSIKNSILFRCRAATNQCNLRHLSISHINFKRRKTAEERKAPRIIEFSPKAKQHKNKSLIDIWRNMTVQQLADSMGRDLEHIQEIMLYVDGVTDLEPNTHLENPKIIRDIVAKAGVKARVIAPPHAHQDTTEKVRDAIRRPPPQPEVLKPRPPVVTVMGHVDHGKTSLLDALRGASVAQGEAGGITQHIGAFTVNLDGGHSVTFLDTPGHAAFSAMRARGASVTDIIVLVVAADDGVMAQTREVVSLAQESEVPVLVAINKIDKSEANLDRCKQELLNLGLNLETNGGDVQVVPISATKGTNLKGLTEALSLQAHLMDLQGDPTGPVEATVVESQTDARRGKLSTAIIQRGTLRRGCILVSGNASARVRGIFDHAGNPLSEAPPGIPVEILGWRELPLAGEEILEVESEKRASEVLRYRASKSQLALQEDTIKIVEARAKAHDDEYKAKREARLNAGRYRSRREGPRPKESGPVDNTPRVNVIVKGDVHGSVEAILDVLETYTSDEECRLSIVHYGVGDVAAGDLDLAQTFDAVIYAFNVSAPTKLPAGVNVRNFDVIYRLVEDLQHEISSKLPQKPVEEILGEANVLQLFSVSEGRQSTTVLGCRCTKGIIRKMENYKLVRAGELIYDGKLSSMRHLKNEVDSIKKDVECGLRLTDQTVEAKPGDILICYKINMENQKTDWDPGF